MYLFNPASAIKALSIPKKWISRAKELNALLYACGDDIAFWCEELEYDVYELPAREMPDGLPALLSDGVILLRKGQSRIEQVISIAHEICHHEFHGSCVAFRDLTDASNIREESQAECFALLVAEPDLWKYDSITEFYNKSKLPSKYKKLREELFYRIKQ